MASPTSNQRDFATGPAFTPLPYCLLETFPPVPFTGHQKLGVMYQVPSCAAPNQYSQVDCSNSTGPSKEPSADVVWRGADPFVVYSWLPCAFVGSGDEIPEDLRNDTRAAHENNVKRVVGEIFWTGGELGDDQYQRLSSDTAVTVTSGGSDVLLQTAATVVTGSGIVGTVGALEQNMADCYGGVPVLHVPHGFLAQLAAEHLLMDEPDAQGRLRTKAGSIVVTYAGDNTGPDGSAAPAGSVWLYATGQIKTWAGEIRWTARDAGEMLVKATNGTVLIAEQRFMVGWDCCHFAALVSLA